MSCYVEQGNILKEFASLKKLRREKAWQGPLRMFYMFSKIADGEKNEPKSFEPTRDKSRTKGSQAES